MAEVDINKFHDAELSDENQGTKEQLINGLKKATFYVEYFKNKGDSKYNEVKGLYIELTMEINKAIEDNKIETKTDLEKLKKDLNTKSEHEKIIDINIKFNELISSDKGLNSNTISILESSKLDKNEKAKLFFEIHNNLPLISHIKDSNIIIEFFEFYKGYNLSDFYKYTQNFIMSTPMVIESYVKNTSQINLNLIPDSYFNHKIEGNNKIEKITTEIINGNPNKIDTRIRGLFLRLKNYDEDIIDIINTLLKNEKTRGIIENNLPIELINNIKIKNHLEKNGININTEIEKNPKKKFSELGNKILKLNSNKSNYHNLKNKLIDEIDSFVIKNGIPDIKLYKEVIFSDFSKIERFASINNNKEIAKEVIKDPKGKAVFMSLGTELRKDIDLIKEVIKNKYDLARGYFINIETPEILIESYKILKKAGCDDIHIFSFPNFANAVRDYTHEGNINGYLMKYGLTKDKNDLDISNKLKEIKGNFDKQENLFSETLKGVELILNNESKGDYEKIILENLKNKEQTQKFLDILYQNSEFSLTKENYSDLLEICGGNEKVLKSIFDKLVVKQAEIYSDPKNLKNVINELIISYQIDIEKTKIILKDNKNLNKYLKIINSNNGEQLDIDNELIINNFKNYYENLKKENPAINKNDAIKFFLENIGLGESLGIDESKLKKILGSVLQFEFKKVEKQTIAENKNIAYQNFSGQISQEEYNKIFEEKYNKKLEENGLPKDEIYSNKNNQNSPETNNIIENKNYTYNYDTGELDINTPNGKQKLNLTPEEAILAQDENYRENLINFYSFFKDLNLIGVWNFRHDLVNAVGNINIDLTDDSLSKSELLNFGNKLINFINNTGDIKLNNNNNSINSLNSELLKYTNAGSSLSDNKTYNLKGEDRFTAKLRELGIIGGAYFHINNFRNLLNNKKES